MTKKESISLVVLTIVMTFMEMSALPAGLFVNIVFKDINPVYFALMANFLLAFLLCFVAKKQLAILNNQLVNQVIKKRKRLKFIVIGIAATFIATIAIYIFCFWQFEVIPRQNAVLFTTEIECELNGETYRYGVTYNQNYQIIEAGGDAWVANHVNVEQYDDANILLAQIEDYFTSRGGSYTVITTD